MTFVLVTFAFLATTGLLMRLCISHLTEATTILDGLSAQNWLETSQQLNSAVVDLDQQISRNKSAWAK